MSLSHECLVVALTLPCLCPIVALSFPCHFAIVSQSFPYHFLVISLLLPCHIFVLFPLFPLTFPYRFLVIASSLPQSHCEFRLQNGRGKTCLWKKKMFWSTLTTKSRGGKILNSYIVLLRAGLTCTIKLFGWWLKRTM